MLNIDEAQKLMIDLIALRKRAIETKSIEDQKQFQKHETICINKFEYLVIMHARQYKSFANYEDLTQEGLLALVTAMHNYNPKKGNFFWWAHKYISTRIARAANTHTTIRYPLKVAKSVAPRKESKLPLLINTDRPDTECEKNQTVALIQNSMGKLTDEQKSIINLAYGIDGEKPLSVNKICKRLGITRTKCINKIEEAMRVLKDNIRL